jgi:hypothetical protein
LGTLSIVAIAVLINVLGARHFRRFDVTKDHRYSLSPATLTTLRELREPVHVWVLMSSGDPLRESVKQVLVAYQAESSKVETHFINPDREPVQYADIRRRFKMDAGRSKGGVVSDAVLVVSQGDRSWFISPADLLEVEKSDDPRAKPREERALTGAIRSVQGGVRTRLCFTTGHGERDIKDGSADGAAFLATLLEKDNYEVTSVDPSPPGAQDVFKGCDTVVVAGPRAAFTPLEENRLKSYLLLGGSAVMGVGPINANTETGLARPGLGEALAPFGIGLDEDLVFEADDHLAFPDSMGIRFVGIPKDSALTGGLVPSPGSSRVVPRVIVHLTRSLRRVTGPDVAVPQELVVSSDKAYGVVNLAGASDWAGTPPKKGADISGPCTLVMASERSKVKATDAHGPRVVVFGSGSTFLEVHWRVEGEGRGSAMLVENAIAWASARPQVLDVPDRQMAPVGIRITQEARSEIRNYVLIYIPLAAVLLAAFVFFRRRSGERAPYRLASDGVTPAPTPRREEAAPRKKKKKP